VTLSIPSTAARSWSSTTTPIGPASTTVHRPKVAIQFVEAGTNREQAIALSLNLGPDVWVGIGLGTVPTVLRLAATANADPDHRAGMNQRVGRAEDESVMRCCPAV
jgi:hypothetical protein